MKFGHFDDARKEYVIETPNTPYPWINYLGYKDFFTMISNTGGGYSFFKDARLRRITRFRYNNVPMDDGGKYFYIKDGDTVWTPGFRPVKTPLDKYECRHGMGYTVIHGEKNGLSADCTYFVPMDFAGEIHKVELTNNSNETKEIDLHSFIEFSLWDGLDDQTNYQRNLSVGEVEVEGNVVYHKTEYRERRNHFSFYSVNEDICGFDTDREDFLGIYNGYDRPATVFDKAPTNSIAVGWAPCASHYLKLTLKPGESKAYIFVLGYVENEQDKKWTALNVINKENAYKMIAQFDTVEKADKALQELKDYWDELLSTYTIKSNDEKLDRMVNIWNQYQTMITFNMSRSASYFESGIGRGMGFRDSNQDLLGFVHLDPVRSRERLLDLAATQMVDGGAYHQYQPLTKKGNNEIGGNFGDDPMWLVAAAAAYIKETGDTDVLKEMVPFDNKEELADTLFEHLKRSFYHVVNNKGPHNLPLIGRADWNDCLNLNCMSNTVGESFQCTEHGDGKVAESLMIAGQFVYYGRDFVKLAELMGKTDEAETAKKHIVDMERAVMEHGWDGEWFIRAYDYKSRPLGSHKCEDGKIFIESQGWCTMAEIGKEEGMPIKALDSAWKYLNTPYGFVLLDPPYSRFNPEIGEIGSFIPGYKENGGVFCHNNPWIVCAETIARRGDKAFEIYKKTAPAYIEDISEIHRLEPYVYAQMVAGKPQYAKKPGEAKNSFLTGTAAWNFVAVSQFILGIRPTYDGLMVDPCCASDMEFTVTRKFRGNTFIIDVKNPNKVCCGVSKMIVDGKEVEGNVLKATANGDVHKVEITLGE